MARLDQELLRRGMARSRTHAATLIAAGRVSLAGAVATKPSVQVQPGQQLTITSVGPEFASRAGHKLAGALSAFPIDVDGLRCLDAGASTGGFTDVLLQAGAAKVVAVDVGHGQLVRRLRMDQRVDVHEGLNVRYLKPADIGGTVELTVCDLSFISLTLVIDALAGATAAGGNMILMVKPQFEVGRGRLSHTGVVTSPGERLRAVGQVLHAVLARGLEIASVVPSTLEGQDGNLEFFLWIKVPNPGSLPRIGTTPEKTVAGWLAALTEKTMEGR